MNIRTLALLGSALVLSAPVFASTYYGGFEDTQGASSDYDYNDIVFSLSGANLVMNAPGGALYAQPVLGTNSQPFWNNTSYDGQKYNIGYCIYGGGNCGNGIAPGVQYLASSSNKNASANDITFSVAGSVSADVYLQITADTDSLGWYSTSDPNHTVHLLNSGGSVGVFSFNPNGSFGLVGENGRGNTYYSQTSLNPSGSQDDLSHFAMFAAPEPGATGLMAAGLIGLGFLFRRRKTN